MLANNAAASTTSTTTALPVEMQHVVREEARLRDILPPELAASLEAGTVANIIIKHEKAEQELHVLAIARRLKYCLSA